MEQTKPTPFLSDKEIIRLYWTRNETAIAETDRKYGKLLIRVAGRVLSDPIECEECKTDTYLRVWRSIPPTKPRYFPGFLSSIARIVAVNRYRKKKQQTKIPNGMTVALEELAGALPDAANPQEAAEDHELGEAINGFVASLPTQRRALFVLRYYFAEPVTEIAASLSIPLSTAYRELEKIRQNLKEYLERKELYP